MQAEAERWSAWFCWAPATGETERLRILETDVMMRCERRVRWGLLVGVCTVAAACRGTTVSSGSSGTGGVAASQAPDGAGGTRVSVGGQDSGEAGAEAASGQSGGGVAGEPVSGSGGTAGDTVSVSGGAGGDECPDGTETCPCHGNNTCNDGLTCASGLCVDLGTGGAPGVGGSAGGGTIGDGGNPTGGVPGAGGVSSAGAAGAAGWGGVTPGVGGGEFTGAGEAYDPTAFEDCASDVRAAESRSTDLLIMVDRSVSMGEHRVPEPIGPMRWDVVALGLTDFVQSQESDGLSVGIHFFPQDPPPQNPDEEVSCLVEDYRTPTVEIGMLPGNAPAIVGAITSQTLGTLTPSYPALQGALEHAAEWQAANPNRPVAVVYATDGFPTYCENMNTDALVDLAGQYANPSDSSPRIRTFVLGVGLNDTNALSPYLHDIARAGATHQAQIVYSDRAIPELAERLHRMAFSPVQCELEVPQPLAGEIVDPAHINLLFTPLGRATEIIRQVPDAGSCAVSGGGWYYDDSINPDSILVCEQTCEFFGGGVVELLLGCETHA